MSFNPTIRLLTIPNTAPSINDVSILMNDGSSDYIFNSGQFQVNFTDAEGDLPNLVEIISLPTLGILTFDGTIVTEGFIFNIQDADKLKYTRTELEYETSFIFQTSDNNETNNLFSNMANFTITVEGQINEPPVVGDGTATTEYNTPIVFTRAMFTTNTTPPYNDPEGDAALSLKITSLPSVGVIQLNGINITVNQIFDFTDDIDSGNLVYVPDPSNTGTYSPDFTFEIADAGSGQFAG